MKRYMVWWGALFFLVMFTSLYLMLETVTNPVRNYSGIGIGMSKTHAMEGIEIKIQKIEEDLVKNKGLIADIKIWVRLLAKGDKKALGKLVELVNSPGDHVEKKGGKRSEETHKPIDGQGQGQSQTQKQGQGQTQSQGADSVRTTKAKEIYEVSPVSEVKVTGGMCMLAGRPAADADIDMKQVIDLLPFDNPDGGAWKQGWDVQYDGNQLRTNKLKIFVVPHSHCDPGWVKTLQDYYTQQMRLIFENMLPKLEADKRRKFIFAEISYLSLWWDELDSMKRDRVKKLVDGGQLEIVTGGWVMTDEANAHYFAMIDQLMEGHQWLNSTLGVKPRSGWAIDPFGYSSTMAYLLKNVGFDNMLIQRVHYSIKKHLARQKNLEFRWRQTWDQEHTTDMFCHMMPFYSYDIPHTCGPDPKVCCQFDFRRLPGSKYNCPWQIPPVSINDQNVASRADLLLDQYRKKAQLYRTNVVLAPLGDDFRYDTPEEWDLQYNNYQQLFDYINTHPELGAQGQFGTLTEYFTAVHEEVGEAPSFFPALTGDFFTYADRDDHYWSGYFTSRPFHKHLDRVLEANLRSAEIIFTLAQAYARKHTASNFPSVALMEKLVTARRSLGLFQHHDGITGTAKDFVVNDYGARMLHGLAGCKRVMGESATFLLAHSKAAYKYSEDSPFLTMDEIRETHDSLPYKPTISVGSEPSSVVLYNSLPHRRAELVTLWSSVPDVEVRGPDGKVVHSQTQPRWDSSNPTPLAHSFAVSFVAEVPALGLAVYTLRQVADGDDTRNHLASVTFRNADATNTDGRFSVRTETSTEDFTIKNSILEVKFDGVTGLMKSVRTLETGTWQRVGLQFLLYGVVNGKERSGAYLFLPDGPGQVQQHNQPVIRIHRGPLVSEVHVFTPLVHHVVRLLNTAGVDSASIDVHNVVDIRSLNNREIAMRISTDVANTDRVFFTDLNGFQMQRRQTYDKLPLQANVYPMPAGMLMQDTTTRFSVLTAQALGVSVMTPGVVDVMLDRRLDQDDGRGLQQGVLDNRATPNQFRLLIETPHTMTLALSPPIAYPSLMFHVSSLHLTQPLFAFPRVAASAASLPLVPQLSPMGTELPCEVHLLNLRTQQNKDDDPAFKYIPKDSAAMLLHHLGSDCSFPLTGAMCQAGNGKVILSEMFADFKLGDLHETSLTMMHEHKDMTGTTVYEVPPMEIRTLRTSLL